MKAWNRKRKPKHTIKTVYKNGIYLKEYKVFQNCIKVSFLSNLKFNYVIIRYKNYKFKKVKID